MEPATFVVNTGMAPSNTKNLPKSAIPFSFDICYYSLNLLENLLQNSEFWLEKLFKK